MHCLKKNVQFADKIDFNLKCQQNGVYNCWKWIFIGNTYFVFKWMITSIEAMPDSPYSSIEFEWVFDVKLNGASNVRDQI